MIPLWALKLLFVTAVLGALWGAWHTLGKWHESHVQLPLVQAQLAKELACEKESECDKRSEERANQAAADAAVAASTAVAAALASEEATRREAAAWRARFREAKDVSPACATWAAQAVGCPL